MTDLLPRFKAITGLMMLVLAVSPDVTAKTSGTHQNTIRKEVIYVVEGDTHEARITFIEPNGKVEHDIVRVPWKLRIAMPCKSRVSIGARNLSASGSIIAKILIEGTVVKEVRGEGHLAGVFAESRTCP
jgi:hypothetical protein